jgi:hypothetical protein
MQRKRKLRSAFLMAKNTLLLSGKCGAHRVPGGQGLDGTLEGNERRHALADTHSASLLHRAHAMRRLALIPCVQRLKELRYVHPHNAPTSRHGHGAHATRHAKFSLRPANFTGNISATWSLRSLRRHGLASMATSHDAPCLWPGRGAGGTDCNNNP